jgi:G3E family GTPase
MRQFQCSRRFGEDVLAADWDQLTETDFEKIMRCGYRIEDHIKYQVEQENGYKSLFYFYLHMDEQQIRDAVKDLFADPACGTIHRIKGFVRMDNGEWIQINAVRDKIEFARRNSGQEAVIVIGEDLHKEAVDRYLVEHAVYHGEL